MKRKILMIFFIFIYFSIFSQTNVCVDIDDEVYSILNIAEVQGLCTPLLNVKPYTQKYILKKIEEIKNNIYKSEYQTNVMSSEVEYIENYIKKFENKLGFDFQKFSYRIQNQNQKFPLSFEFNDEINILGSVGLYQTPSQNAFAYDIYNNFNFTGDITKYFSYRATLFAGLTYLPLQDLGSYNIGRWWYSPLIPETSDVGSANQNRTVNVKRYNSYLPFSLIILIFLLKTSLNLSTLIPSANLLFASSSVIAKAEREKDARRTRVRRMDVIFFMVLISFEVCFFAITLALYHFTTLKCICQ